MDMVNAPVTKGANNPRTGVVGAILVALGCALIELVAIQLAQEAQRSQDRPYADSMSPILVFAAAPVVLLLMVPGIILWFGWAAAFPNLVAKLTGADVATANRGLPGAWAALGQRPDWSARVGTVGFALVMLGWALGIAQFLGEFLQVPAPLIMGALFLFGVAGMIATPVAAEQHLQAWVRRSPPGPAPRR